MKEYRLFIWEKITTVTKGILLYICFEPQIGILDLHQGAF